jgi:peptide/nickel transport system permease protein
MAISTHASAWRSSLDPLSELPTSLRFGRVLARRRVALIGAVVIALMALLAVVGPFIAPYDPISQRLLDRLQPPSASHWMGTDHLGRDILSRLLFGARITLGIALAAASVAAFVGIVVGTTAGYYGGRLDGVLMRVVDLLLALPSVLFALTIIAALGSSVPNLVVAIACAGVPTFARLARGSALSIRTADYIESARAVGAGDARIVIQHILPNISAPLIVQFTLLFSNAVLAASALSFLGLGVQPPTPEWGAMLSDARSVMQTAPHVAIFPGCAILLSVLGLNLLGDGLRDALDPRLRSQG